MRITADTNVLVRFVVADDPGQAAAAAALLERAEAVVLTVPVLCEPGLAGMRRAWSLVFEDARSPACGYNAALAAWALAAEKAGTERVGGAPDRSRAHRAPTGVPGR